MKQILIIYIMNLIYYVIKKVKNKGLDLINRNVIKNKSFKPISPVQDDIFNISPMTVKSHKTNYTDNTYQSIDDDINLLSANEMNKKNKVIDYYKKYSSKKKEI